MAKSTSTGAWWKIGAVVGMEAALTERPWQQARPSVRVKLLPRDAETYVFAESQDRIHKERSMRRRRLRACLDALRAITQRKRPLKRDALHQSIGAAKKAAGRDARFVLLIWAFGAESAGWNVGETRGGCGRRARAGMGRRAWGSAGAAELGRADGFRREGRFWRLKWEGNGCGEAPRGGLPGQVAESLGRGSLFFPKSPLGKRGSPAIFGPLSFLPKVMNVEFQALPNCIANLRIEVEPDAVTKKREEVTKQYTKHAKLPGFRAGKAPRSVVERKFNTEIKDEVTKQVLTDATRQAITDKGLRVLSLSEVDDVVWGDDQSLKFRATVILQPAFDLPDYKGIPVTVPSTEVTEAEVDQAIENLREQQADFPDVEPARPAAMEDYVVVDYDGTIDGEPVHVKFPKAGKPLTHNTDFWIKMTDEAFFPGFCANLVGANTGETREFDVEVPADFPVEGMPGTKIHYKVTLKGVKTRTLPELNDAFADSISKGKTLQELRELAREELERQKKNQAESTKRSSVMSALLAKVECELPSHLVRQQTQSILMEIWRENQSRGVTEEVLKEHERELVGSAAQSAREKLKGNFVLLRIAEQEKIRVTEAELRARINQLARRYEMGFDKMLKELQKRKAVDQISEEILTAKALDLVANEASVTTAPAGAEPQAEGAAAGGESENK